jgi:hypothetical protein
MQKVFSKLIGLQYKIVYKRGSDNRVPDSTSRHPKPHDHLVALSTCTPLWLEQVQQGYNKDPKSQQLLQSLSLALDAMKHYTLHNGIIKYKRRVWIGNNPPLHQQILQALHATTIGGHSRFPVTYNKLK